MNKIKIKELLAILGIKKLKPKQKEIINFIINNLDVIGILPTGYGKSVCYILPHLISNRNVIVISPLISLMQDQTTKLKEKGILSINFNSTNKIPFELLDDLINNEVSGILYFSPESFIGREDFIKDILKNTCLIAIDECHCITTWNDFRSCYRKLDNIQKWIKEDNTEIPILALTATATDETVTSIKKNLLLDDPKIVKTSFYRDNLSISIFEKNKYQEDVISISKLIKKSAENREKTIIYCKTQKETEKFVESLLDCGIESCFYHGGMTNKSRNISQNKFRSGEVDVIIATIAFGMGIDISDISLIIHYGISKDIESYYQEIGRAGRNNNDAKCYMYWSKKDFVLNRHFLDSIKNTTRQKKQLERIISIEKLIYTEECRMKFILKYFDEEFERCDKCDNCIKKKNPIKEKSPKKKIDSTNNVGVYFTYIILKTLFELDYGCGCNNLIGILYGSKNKKINDRMRKLKTYGILKKKSDDNLNDKIRKLQHIGLIEEQKISNFATFLKISELGKKWFTEYSEPIKESLDILKNKFYNNINFKKVEKERNPKFLVIMDELKKWRNNICSEKNIPTYCVLQNKTLELIAEISPKNLDELKELKGIGDTTLKKYGNDLLDICNS